MFTGRFHLVRNWWLPTGTLSEPYVLDRHNKTLNPYRGNASSRLDWEPREQRSAALRAWQRQKRRILDEPDARRQARLAERLLSRHADCRQLAAFFDKNDLFCLKLFLDATLSTTTTMALDSAYVAGTSGDAIAAKYAVPVGGKTLNSVYFYVSSYTGTAANVNDINLEVRAEASTGAVTPNTSATVAVATKDPASATGWIASTGWSAALTALARYFAIVGDADGNGTDFATLNRSTSGPQDTPIGSQTAARYMVAQTTGGWASGSSAVAAAAANIVLAFSDSTTIGNPLTTNAAPASDTNRRGLRIGASGLIANLPIFGVIWTVANANLSGLEIYSTANVPGTSPGNTSTDLFFNASAGKIGCLTSGGTPYSLTAGVAHRIVATYSGSTTGGPQRMDIGTGEDATLRLAMPGAGNFYYARANGTTDWTNDLVGSLPAMGLLVDGQVAAAAGGGMLIHGGMMGGLV